MCISLQVQTESGDEVSHDCHYNTKRNAFIAIRLDVFEFIRYIAKSSREESCTAQSDSPTVERTISKVQTCYGRNRSSTRSCSRSYRFIIIKTVRRHVGIPIKLNCHRRHLLLCVKNLVGHSLLLPYCNVLQQQKC